MVFCQQRKGWTIDVVLTKYLEIKRDYKYIFCLEIIVVSSGMPNYLILFNMLYLVRNLFFNCCNYPAAQNCISMLLICTTWIEKKENCNLINRAIPYAYKISKNDICVQRMKCLRCQRSIELRVHRVGVTNWSLFLYFLTSQWFCGVLSALLQTIVLVVSCAKVQYVILHP